MDSNLKSTIEDMYEQVYPMSETLSFERINPKNKERMVVPYTVLGIDFAMKLNKPKDYVAILVLENQKRKDKRIEGLILDSSGFTVNQDNYQDFEYTGSLGQKIEKIHNEGEIWIEGTQPPSKSSVGFLKMIKSFF